MSLSMSLTPVYNQSQRGIARPMRYNITRVTNGHVAPAMTTMFSVRITTTTWPRRCESGSDIAVALRSRPRKRGCSSESECATVQARYRCGPDPCRVSRTAYTTPTKDAHAARNNAAITRSDQRSDVRGWNS